MSVTVRLSESEGLLLTESVGWWLGEIDLGLVRAGGREPRLYRTDRMSAGDMARLQAIMDKLGRLHESAGLVTLSEAELLTLNKATTRYCKWLDTLVHHTGDDESRLKAEALTSLMRRMTGARGCLPGFLLPLFYRD